VQNLKEPIQFTTWEILS